MKIDNIPTDESLRSLMAHGSADFPFEYYMDEIDRFRERCIEWHWHEEVEFSLVVRGSVRCLDEINACLLSQGDGLFINSGTLHRFDSDDGGVMMTAVFAPELIAPRESLLFSEYVEVITASDCPLLRFGKDDRECSALLERLRLLYDAAGRNRLAVHNAASTLWEELFYLTGGGATRPQSRVDKLLRARMQKMVYHIHQNYQSHMSLEEIAAAANISVSEALRCFHASMQTTPVQYLRLYRLECAKKLLLSTADPVTGIALGTGFESPGYFCRVFKSKYGASPNEYRRLMAKRQK